MQKDTNGMLPKTHLLCFCFPINKPKLSKFIFTCPLVWRLYSLNKAKLYHLNISTSARKFLLCFGLFMRYRVLGFSLSHYTCGITSRAELLGIAGTSSNPKVKDWKLVVGGS